VNLAQIVNGAVILKVIVPGNRRLRRVEKQMAFGKTPEQKAVEAQRKAAGRGVLADEQEWADRAEAVAFRTREFEAAHEHVAG
jgi:hypothetical protein